MKLAGRVKKLETRASDRPPAEPEYPDEDGWLDRYAAWGAAGLFAHEPDFPTALAECRVAIEGARASVGPPWVVPDDFMPLAKDKGVYEAVRRHDWRARHFPAARAALDWLGEMRHRVIEGIPPVSEVEFAGLAAWLEANAARLDALADRNRPGLLDVGVIGSSVHRVRVRSWMVRYDLRGGPRAWDSGRCAETIRRLRSMFPVVV